MQHSSRKTTTQDQDEYIYGQTVDAVKHTIANAISVYR